MQFYQSRSWNNRGYFIFVSATSLFSEILLKYVTFVNNLGVTNSVIIFTNSFDDTEILAYDYFDGTLVKLTSNEEFVVHLSKNFLRDVGGDSFRASFRRQIPSMMINKLSNLEGSFVHLITIYSRHVNATLQWDFQLASAPAGVRPSQFARSEIDIAPNVHLVNWPYIEPVLGSVQECLVLLISEVLKGSFFDNLEIPFSKATWFVLVFLLVSTQILNRVLKKCLPGNLLLMTFFGASWDTLGRLERFVLFSMVVLTFLLSEAYLAIMTSYMLNVDFEPHLETMLDFERSSVQICMNPGEDTKLLRKILIDELRIDLPEGRIIVSTSSKKWREITTCAWLMRHEAAEVILESAINYDLGTMRKKFYMLPQRLTWGPKLHSMARWRPFREHFFTTLDWVVEAGFWTYWNEDARLRNQQQTWDSLKIFSFDDLVSLWFILASGCALSLSVFVGEVLIKKMLLNFLSK